MPAAITHYLHAKRVLEAMQKRESSFQVVGDAFYWGAQGPDFLFCSRFLPWQKGEKLSAYGSRLHDLTPSLLFRAIKQYETAHSNEPLPSYILGFLCHYSADRICHPFISFGAQTLLKEDPSQSEEVFHNQIESALDTIMLRYETAQLPLEFPLKRAVPKNESVMKAAAGLYVYLFQELFQKKVSLEQMVEAFRDCRTIFGLLTDRTGFKKNLVEKLEGKKKRSISCHIRPLSEKEEIDYANVLNGEWQWPPESETYRDESFFALYERAIRDSMELLKNWPDITDMTVFTEEIPFGG